jgi:ADP-ribosyl-[dinitrogen reductase] hydrolase
MTDLQDRLRGIAVGAVVGDALGMPLEFKPPRSEYNLETEMVKGPLPAGTFTDDTEMALALAESLFISSPLDVQDLAGRFTGWYQSRPSDIGIHTAAVLKLIAEGVPVGKAAKQVQKKDPDSAGNGGLMRTWPIAIARHKQPGFLTSETALQTELTHCHADCINGSLFLNSVLYQILQESQRPAAEIVRIAIQKAKDQVALDEDFLLAINLAPMRMRNDLKNSGWVRDTLESALWAVMTTLSFEEALVRAVNLGNDADTTGAVTGAIAGALYGLSGIPARWKDAIHGEYPLRSGKLWFVKDFIELADKLAVLSDNDKNV